MTTTTATARVTIGLTENAREGNYFPAMDGYRPGAAQMQVHLDVPLDLLAGRDPEDVAEAAFAATNEPQMFLASRDPLVAWMAAEVLPRREVAQIGDMRSMSVGDTVVMGDTAFACASCGWTRL